MRPCLSELTYLRPCKNVGHLQESHLLALARWLLTLGFCSVTVAEKKGNLAESLSAVWPCSPHGDSPSW